MGRLVTTLVNREVEAGYHEVIWNGCTNEGKKVANSVYFYRMQTEGNCTPIKKMVLLQ
jgi:flagellar hook assembly protein FlgD